MLTLDFSDLEMEAIRCAIVAVLCSPDIDPEEFGNYYGVPLRRMKLVLHHWPQRRFPRESDTELTIHGCLNDVCSSSFFEKTESYLVGLRSEDWAKWFPISRAEYVNLFERWLLITGR